MKYVLNQENCNMKPIEFPEKNAVFAENQPEYLPLPAHIVNERERRVITCWELNPLEIDSICKTRKVWLAQMTFGQPLQPVFMCIDKCELFDGVQNNNHPELLPMDLTHSVEIHLGIIDRFRVLFGGVVRYNVSITIDRPFTVVSDKNNRTWIEDVFSKFRNRKKKREFLMSNTTDKKDS